MIHIKTKKIYLTVQFGINILIYRFGVLQTEKSFVYIYKFIYVPLPHSIDNP